MTYSQLTEYLARHILRRPKMLDSETEIVALQTAIDMAHWQIQRDADWRCMEACADLTYPAGGRTGVEEMPAYYKRARQVRLGSCDTARVPIKRATEEEVNRVIGAAYRGGGVNEDDLAANGYEQRWYEKEEKIYLLLRPAEETALLLDYYRFLQPYAEAEDEDWFAQKAFDVLLFGAAMLGCLSLWEHDQSAKFAATYEFLKGRAIRNDREIKAGGADALQGLAGLAVQQPSAS